MLLNAALVDAGDANTDTAVAADADCYRVWF